MTYYTRMRYNPNHVPDGPDGGQFTGAGAGLAKITADPRVDRVDDGRKYGDPIFINLKPGFNFEGLGSFGADNIKMANQFLKEVVTGKTNDELYDEALSAVAQKFNPNHVPDGPDGGQFTSGEGGSSSDGGTSVSFEVAPDPNNKPLTKQWNKLSDANKLLISRQVAADIIPGAMKALGTTGTLVDQIGGYLGATNPSLSLEIDSAHAVDAAKLLGYALSQDSMMVVSAKAAPGLDKVGVVAVNLPEGQRDIASLTKIHDTLYALKDSSGEPVVTGFSSSHGRMDILNYSSVSDKELAGMVDKALGGKYEVQHTTGYSSFVEKKDYLNASSTVEGASAVWGKSASDLRDAASKAVEAHLQTHVPSGKTEGLKAVYVIQPKKAG